jgi:hypothetical protein
MTEDSANQTTSGSDVFVSYASQDTGAAQRICETLRAAGIEVWFDQSELSPLRRIAGSRTGALMPRHLYRRQTHTRWETLNNGPSVTVAVVAAAAR